MKSFEPDKTDPAGVPSPFDRHNETESILATIFFGSIPSFVIAFIRRAPSKWIESPLSFPQLAIFSISFTFKTLPW